MYLLLGLFFSSCDVHEFPDNGIVPTVTPGNNNNNGNGNGNVSPDSKLYTVHLNFEYDTDMELNPQSINIESRSGDGMKMRHTINFYSGHSINADGTDTPAYSYTIINDVSDTPDFSADFELPLGDYTCIIWSNYTNNDADLYYTTSDFHNIAIASQTDYQADTDYRDAFKGKQEFTVYESQTSVIVSLTRPLAKYEILAADFTEFVAQELSISSSYIELSDYKVTVYYTGFTPCKYNLFSNKVSDSWTGLTYSLTPIKYDKYSDEIDSDYVLLASDYIFVNNTETSVNLYIEITDQAGRRIMRSSTFSVPLIRSCDTIAIGSFMTSTNSAGGAAINPDYNGEFNLEF